MQNAHIVPFGASARPILIYVGASSLSAVAERSDASQIRSDEDIILDVSRFDCKRFLMKNLRQVVIIIENFTTFL